VVLIINKIDAMPGAEGLKKKFEQERQEIEAKYNNNHKRRTNALKNELGARVNAHVAKFIEPDNELHDLIDLFYRYLKGSQVPNRVFLCTSVGFGYEEGKSALNPYGTCAAFLWAVYAPPEKPGAVHAEQLAAECRRQLVARHHRALYLWAGLFQ
jgi:hypothetical protein